jgi:hypothetical protein
MKGKEKTTWLEPIRKSSNGLGATKMPFLALQRYV